MSYLTKDHALAEIFLRIRSKSFNSVSRLACSPSSSSMDGQPVVGAVAPASCGFISIASWLVVELLANLHDLHKCFMWLPMVRGCVSEQDPHLHWPRVCLAAVTSSTKFILRFISVFKCNSFSGALGLSGHHAREIFHDDALSRY